MTQLGFDGRPPQGLPFLNSLWLNSVHPFLLHLFHWTEGGCRLQSVGSIVERQKIYWWLNFTCRDHGSFPTPPVFPLTVHLPSSFPLCSPQFFSQGPLIICFCQLKGCKAFVGFTADNFSLRTSCGGLCKVWQLKVNQNMPERFAKKWHLSMVYRPCACKKISPLIFQHSLS